MKNDQIDDYSFYVSLEPLCSACHSLSNDLYDNKESNCEIKTIEIFDDQIEGNMENTYLPIISECNIDPISESTINTFTSEIEEKIDFIMKTTRKATKVINVHKTKRQIKPVDKNELLFKELIGD